MIASWWSLGVLLLASAAPAVAQIAPGQSGSSTLYYMGRKEAFDTLSEFGKCYASTSRNDALKLVATQAGTVQEAQTYKHLFEKPYQSCLGNVTDLQISSAFVRGSIAEGLYWKRVPVPPNLMITQPPDAAQVHSLSEAAICYVGRHRNTAQELVEGTGPGTKKEISAVAALMADFAECIPPTARASLGLDPTLVRFRIAEALWRLGAVPAGASAESTR